MDKQEFVDLMIALRATYPQAVANSEWWGQQIAAYWSQLKTYSAADLRRAFGVALRRYPDWFPSCGQLLQLLDGDPATRAEQAWPELCRLATSSSGEHSDPVAREAIALLGGGAALGRISSADLHGWWRKRFVDSYCRLAKDIAKIGPRGQQDACALPTHGQTRGDDENAGESHGGGRTEATCGMDTHAGTSMHEYTERGKTWWQ